LLSSRADGGVHFHVISEAVTQAATDDDAVQAGALVWLRSCGDLLSYGRTDYDCDDVLTPDERAGWRSSMGSTLGACDINYAGLQKENTIQFFAPAECCASVA